MADEKNQGKDKGKSKKDLGIEEIPGGDLEKVGGGTCDTCGTCSGCSHSGCSGCGVQPALNQA